jgi:hypothetical protein
MPIGEIRSAMRQQPFQPLSVQTGDGPAAYVRHPDFIATATNERTTAV